MGQLNQGSCELEPILSECRVVVGTIEGRSIHRRKIGEVLVVIQQSSSVRWLLVTSFGVFFAVAGIAEGAEPSSGMPVALDAHDAQLKWGPCPPLFPKGCEIAVLRGDPSKPNADVFLKVPANYTIPPHWHTSAERMVLVSGELHVEYDGHSSSVLKPGTPLMPTHPTTRRDDFNEGVHCRGEAGLDVGQLDLLIR